jgi:hypothetical protein
LRILRRARRRPTHDIGRFFVGEPPFGEQHGAEGAAHVAQMLGAGAAVLIDVEDAGFLLDCYPVGSQPKPPGPLIYVGFNRCDNGDSDDSSKSSSR